MEKSISELMISKQAKRVFSEMGIERLSQLQKYNWDSIDTDGSVPVECFIKAVEELMKKGFLPIPDSEVLICKSGLSTRVCNMLRSKRMLFLSHLSRYSEDEVRKFYYFGEKSFEELSGVCRRYNIQFKHGKEMEFQRKLKDMSRKQNTEISRETYNTLVEAEITDLSELSEGTVDNICRDKEIDRDCLINALDELMKKGIVPVPDNEVPLCNAGLSVKLSNILKRSQVGSRGYHDGGVIHSAVLLKSLNNGSNRRSLLADGHIDTVNALAPLVDDGIDGNRRLTCLTVADN